MRYTGQYSSFVSDVLDGLHGLDPEAVERKPWGAAVHMGHTEFTQMSLAIIDQGGFCSRHFHKQKVNVFCVIEGELLVHSWADQYKSDSRSPDRTDLIQAGMAIQMPVEVIHEMEGLTNVVCMESYFAIKRGHKVCRNDIHRMTRGGNRNELRK